MSGSMAVGANYLSWTAGGAGAAGTGAYSIAALVRPASGNNNCGIATLLASGSRVRSLFEDNLDLWGENDFTGYDINLTQNTWYLIVQTKAAGSAAYTFYVWVYDPSGTGSVSTGTSQTVGDGSAITEIRFGQAVNNANGLYAVLGVWTRALTLAEVQSMRSAQLSSWRDVAGGPPAELLHLRDWDGAAGAVTAIGTASFSGITGTVSAGANPPSFVFDLAADTTATAAPDLGARPAGSPATAIADATVADPVFVGARPTGSPAAAVGDALVAEPAAPGVFLGGSPASAFAAADETAAVGGGQGLRPGGSPATASTSSAVHDPMVMPILQQVRACLAAELAKLASPPAKLQIRPGSVFTAMVDNTTDECCAGIAYVRPGTDTPTGGNWPAALFDVDGPSASRGAPAYYAVQVEIGVYRCIPVISNVEGNRDAIATEDQWLQAAQEHLDDRAALRRTVCCLREIYGSDGILTGPYTPLQNEGNCGGQFVLLTIRAPACDC